MSIFVDLETFRITDSTDEQYAPKALLTGEALEFRRTPINSLQ